MSASPLLFDEYGPWLALLWPWPVASVRPLRWKLILKGCLCPSEPRQSSGSLLQPIGVVESHDVILAKIAANLNQFQRNFSSIGDPRSHAPPPSAPSDGS